jgi:hypothetical protein
VVITGLRALSSSRESLTPEFNTKRNSNALRKKESTLYLLHIRLNRLGSFGSPGRSAAERVENGDLNRHLFAILVAYKSERHADDPLL